ncbi:transcriptional repressor DicA [Escherichia coli]|uniref:Transcriptional repressor DicA n=1 Tax=Escherichia coli TaxID=562 RepID=A0A376KVT8_ECOLX|nr:transcriptional repressor DicA [Escherichia coli]
MRKKQYDTPLAERLDAISQQHHLSGSDLARIAGVGRSSVNAWKKRGTISKDSAAKIAEATNVSLSWLLTGKEDTSREVLDDDEKALLDVYRNLPPGRTQKYACSFSNATSKLTEFYSEYVDPDNTSNNNSLFYKIHTAGRRFFFYLYGFIVLTYVHLNRTMYSIKAQRCDRS